MNLWVDTSALAGAQALFGVPPLERLRRSLGADAGKAAVILSGPASPDASWPGACLDASDAPLGVRLKRALAEPRSGCLVVVDGANVIDPRLIRHLAGSDTAQIASRGEGAQQAVVLALDASVSAAIADDCRDLRELAAQLLAAAVAQPLDEARFPAYIDKLRRNLPYWIDRVETPAQRRAQERRVFWDNYKGSTDLLTAYVYPPLVWPLTRFCARFRIHPNTVTVLSIVLAFAAVPLWWHAQWWAGFLCAYAMSVLDSVDGKVARLTLTDSRIGNVLDHGLDQVHPPFWYFAWAWGLGAREWADPLYQAGVWFIVFYLVDRIVLGIARKRLGHALHSSTPLDERVRSVIARRNITMTVVALALLLGFGEAGFYAMVIWQALTCAWHGWRTLWLGFIRPPSRA